MTGLRRLSAAAKVSERSDGKEKSQKGILYLEKKYKKDDSLWKIILAICKMLCYNSKRTFFEERSVIT